MHEFLKSFLTITTVSLIGVIHCNHDIFQEFLLELIHAIDGEKSVGCLLLSIVETNVPINSNYSQKVRLSFLFS